MASNFRIKRHPRTFGDLTPGQYVRIGFQDRGNPACTHFIFHVIAYDDLWVIGRVVQQSKDLSRVYTLGEEARFTKTVTLKAEDSRLLTNVELMTLKLEGCE